MWKSISKWLLLIIPLGLLILLFSMKNKLEQYISEKMTTTLNSENLLTIENKIDSLYNYHDNELAYQLTFLEFGARGCVACRKMEFVMDEVRAAYPDQVKVVFLNIVSADSQELMNYYGVAAIPTQLLLDKEGTEFFRHTGYISFDDLSNALEKMINPDR